MDNLLSVCNDQLHLRHFAVFTSLLASAGLRVSLVCVMYRPN